MDFKEQFRVFLTLFNLCVNNENKTNHGTLQKTKADFIFVPAQDLLCFSAESENTEIGKKARDLKGTNPQQWLLTEALLLQ